MMFSQLISIGLMALALPLTNAQSDSNPVTGLQGNASVVVNNPVGPIYTATLPDKSFFNPEDPRGNIKGSISATSNPDGIGVLFQVRFSNLPTSGGPFPYHLHAFPVPDGGNCTDTLGHIDPFIRGEAPACDSALPQTCQVGDLAGKHGLITSDPFTAQYLDEFASLEPGLGSFFGNRSFVLHFANVTRITCANFALEGGNSTGNSTGENTGSSNGTSNGTSTGTSSGTSTQGNATATSRPTAAGSSPAQVTVSGAGNLGVSILLITGMMVLVTLFL